MNSFLFLLEDFPVFSHFCKAMKKKTLVIGASENEARFSNKCIRMLLENGHPVEAIGAREGKIEDVLIQKEKVPFAGIHTVTVYLSPQNQKEYYNYVVNLSPQRVIFNPGTENPEFENLLQQNHIETVEACSLVMMRSGAF